MAKIIDNIEALENLKASITNNKINHSALNDKGTLTHAELENSLNNKVNTTDIVDDLTSTDADKPLSANQGKELEDLKANIAQESWMEPTLLNDFVVSTYNVKFYKSTTNKVRIIGRVGGGVGGTNAFVLPVGYRPPQVLNFACYTGLSTGIARVTIYPAGNVTIINFTSYVSLDVISFRVEN